MNLYERSVTWLLLFSGLCKLTLAGDKIRLRDVEVLTLYHGRMTTGRRSSPVAQLTCSGGSAGCNSFIPHAVQCYNRGSDGYDVQWECKTDMDNKYRFGHIDVNCEGYDYPDDPYILRGSCGLKYTIELNEEGYRKASGHDNGNYHRGHDNGYNNHLRRSRHSHYGVGDVVMLVIIGGIIYMIYSTCTSNRTTQTNDNTVPPSAPPYAPPPYPEQPGFRSAYAGPADPPPPPYSADEPGFKREYTQQGTPSNSTAGPSTSDSSSGYGFWSGAASGGLLGYLFGRNSGTRHYNTPYNGGWGSYDNSYSPRPTSTGWFGSNWFGRRSYGNSYSPPPTNTGWFGSNWFGGRGSHSYRPSSSFGSSSSGNSSRSSSGSRTTSGMGGTSRR